MPNALESLKLRHALGRGVVKRVLDDSPVALRMRYVGTGTVTSVIVTTAVGIIMITSDGGTDSYAFGTYTTIGALADAINRDGIFEVRVLDALRADLTTGSRLVDGAITAVVKQEGFRVWDVAVDTSTMKALTVRLTPDANQQFEGERRGHRVSLKEIKYSADVSAAEGQAVRVYSCTGLGNVVETLIWSAASVDSTGSLTIGLTTISFASGFGKITGRDGEELVIRIQDATSLSDQASNFLEVLGFCE